MIAICPMSQFPTSRQLSPIGQGSAWSHTGSVRLGQIGTDILSFHLSQMGVSMHCSGTVRGSIFLLRRDNVKRFEFCACLYEHIIVPLRRAANPIPNLLMLQFDLFNIILRVINSNFNNKDNNYSLGYDDTFYTFLFSKSSARGRHCCPNYRRICFVVSNQFLMGKKQTSFN